MHQAIDLMRSNKDITKKYYILRDSIINYYPSLLNDIKQIPLVKKDSFFSKDLWFGDGGNITPIHFDAVDNFVVCIFGEKTYYLYPTSSTNFLYPDNILITGRFNFTQIVSDFLVDRKKYPLSNRTERYKVTLKPGDILYIPIGWWHEVWTEQHRAATVTYFFNNRKYTNLLWHFLGYQSCRLHEICNDNLLQEILYLSNYENYLENTYKLLNMKQYWMAVVLISAMLEQLLNTAMKPNNYLFLFDILKQYSSHVFCKNLIAVKNWKIWQQIILNAIQENNQTLSKHRLETFVKEVEEFIQDNKILIEQLN